MTDQEVLFSFVAWKTDSKIDTDNNIIDIKCKLHQPIHRSKIMFLGNVSISISQNETPLYVISKATRLLVGADPGEANETEAPVRL